MAAIMKPFKAIRNHWKKSLFGAILAGFGIKYGLNRYECNQIMRVYCEEAMRYGLTTAGAVDKCRHVTVLLNPKSNDGKGKVLFDKYAAPILHLAGIKVSIVNTEYEGQARALMEVMDNTDAVIISGGDGTVLEVVTGLLRRQDSEIATKRLPIGVMPVGKHNSLSRNVFGSFLDNEAKFIAESAIAVVRNTRKNVDVMRISGESGNDIYALSRIEWGCYRDTFARMSKFWMFGPLKSKVLFLWDSLFKWPFLKSGNIVCTPPCSGCSKCYKPSESKTVKSNNARWWQAFIPKTNVNVIEEKSIDYSKVENDNCGIWTSSEFESSNLRIELDSESDGASSLVFKSSAKDISRMEYIKEGWRRPDSNLDQNEKLIIKAKNIKLNPKIDGEEEEWFSIDNEDFEVKPVEVEVLPQKVQIFCPINS